LVVIKNHSTQNVEPDSAEPFGCELRV